MLNFIYLNFPWISNHKNTPPAEDSASTESLHQARMEMQAALRQRRDALQQKVREKEEELRLLCLREGELTGELPPEYPIVPGQPPPTVRKRVGTSFTINENLINKIINKQVEFQHQNLDAKFYFHTVPSSFITTLETRLGLFFYKCF